MAYLNNKRANHYSNKYRISKDSFEYVSFSMHHTRVDFIEELHQYKGIEDYGRVRGWFTSGCSLKSIFNIKEVMPLEHQDKQHY